MAKVNKFCFLFRYAYRNITRHPFRTISLFLSILMLSFITLTTITIKDALIEGYKIDREVKYYGIDLYVTYDENSKNKIINEEKMQSLYQYVDYYGAFFEFNTVVKTIDEYNFDTKQIKLISGTTEELNNILGTDLAHLQNDEVILTKSLAADLNVKIDNYIYIYIASQTVKYKVVNIIDDLGIMSNNRLFVQKNYYLKQFSYEMLGVDLSNIDNITICNRIYINLKDNIDSYDFIDLIKGPSFYPNSEVVNLADFSSRDANTKMILSSLYGVMIIVGIALIFVLASFIYLRIRQFKNEIGIIKLIGGTKSYLFLVLLIEICFLIIISLFIATLVCYFLYKVEFSIFSGTGDYKYSFKFISLLICLLIVSIVCLFCVYLGYVKYKHLETIALTNDKRYDKNIKIRDNLIIISILVIILIINLCLFKKIFPIWLYAIINIFSVSIICIISISLLVNIVTRLFPTKGTFNLIFIRNLRNNRIKINSLKILLICSVGIVIVLAIGNYANNLIDNITNKLNIDYVLTNVKTYDQQTIDELESYEVIEKAVPATFNAYITTKDKKQSFLSLFSCEINDAMDLLSFDLKDSTKENITNPNIRYIVVNNNFLKGTNYKLGDKISITYSDEDKDYIIIDTADLGYIQFAYTNEIYQADCKVNSIIMKTNETSELNNNLFIDEVTSKHGSKMELLFNMKDLFASSFEQVKVGLNVVYIILVIIVICFIISIINNTILSFKEMQTELAILKVLGIKTSYYNQMIFKEIGLSYGIIFIPMLIMIMVIYIFLPDLTILFGFYITFNTPIIIFIIGLLLSLGCFIISYIYYFIGFRKIKVCQELKK